MNFNSYRFGPQYSKYLYSPSNSAYNFGTGPFTLEAWVKTYTGGPVIARKISSGGSSHGGFFISVSPGKIQVGNDDGSYYNTLTSNTSTICDGQWHHIAAVRWGGSGDIFLDGVALNNTKAGNKEPPLNVNSVDRLTIGTLDQTGATFTGCIAEVRIWNLARQGTQIYQNFRRRLTPAEVENRNAGLVGYWPGEFGVIADFSLSKNSTSYVGLGQGTADCPPLTLSTPSNLCRVFCGIYDTSTKKSSSSTWEAGSQVIVTSRGFVVRDNQVVRSVQTDGTVLSWTSSQNNNSASIKFLNSGSDSGYWSEETNRPVFQGSCTEPNDYNTKSYRGAVASFRLGSGALLNIGTGKFMTCTNPQIASQVTLSDTSVQSRDHFSYWDIGGVLHADSHLALKPADDTSPKSKVLLTRPTLGGTHQSWLMQRDGHIVLKATPTLALSADANGSTVIIDTTDANNSTQKWLSLPGDGQFVWNDLADNAVLVGLDTGKVGVQYKADSSPQQAWYIYDSSFICVSSAQALTVVGGVGTQLELKKWTPGDLRQQFTYYDGDIIHTATGLILITQGSASNATVILADPKTVGTYTPWHISPPSNVVDASSSSTGYGQNAIVKRSLGARTKRETVTLNASLGNFSGGLAPGGFTTYVVQITTSNWFYAGTDDTIEISLENSSMQVSLPFVELKHSLTHPDNPFQKGLMDTFVLFNMQDIGQVTSVTLKHDLHWYWPWADNWIISSMTVTNVKWRTRSLWQPFIPESTETKITIPLTLAPQEKYNCTMVLGKAPAQDAIGKKFGWDHTWIEVVNKADGTPATTTFFDCAGGHRGPGTKLIDMGICTRNSVVKMSTGDDISPSHPLKDAYGSGRTDGVENAHLRCDGKLKWDGQCHQIANRYLYTCIPSMSIDDLPHDEQPHGYGLSVFFFSKYGVGFKDWCVTAGFPPVQEDDYAHFAYWWQTLALNGRTAAKEVYRLVLQLRADISKASDPQPDGEETKKFMQALKNNGSSVADIAKMTNLTEREVEEILPNTGGWGR